MAKLSKELSELVLDKLISAIDIMDSKGREIPESSTALWNKDWTRLRFLLFESLTLLDDAVNAKEIEF